MAKRMRLRALLRERQGNKCCYCATEMVRHKHKHGCRPPRQSETIEHLRRKADGGTSRPDNMALACISCNAGRGALDWLTYKSLKMGEMTA